MSKRGLVEVALVLVMLGGLVRLAEVAPAAQGEPGAYARYGFDRLRYAWEPGAIGADFCLSEEEGGRGFFCDGAQLAMSLVKSVGVYLNLAQRVLGDPPDEVKSVVESDFGGKRVGLNSFSRITKEQVKQVEFVRRLGSNNYFVDRTEPDLKILRAKKRENADPLCDERIKDKFLSAIARFEVEDELNGIVNAISPVVLECYVFEEDLFDPEKFDVAREVVVVLKSPAYKGENAELSDFMPVDSFVDLKEKGLVPQNSDKEYLLSIRSSFDKDGRRWLIRTAVLNGFGLLTGSQIYDRFSDVVVVVRNHSKINSVQLEHARRNATIWPDFASELGLSLSERFPLAEVNPSSFFLLNDALSATLFSDLAQASPSGFDLVDLPTWRFSRGSVTVYPFKLPGLGRLRAQAAFVDIRSDGHIMNAPPITIQPDTAPQSLSELDAARGTRYADNPFLFLPLDGAVGLQDDGSLLRQGYGTDVSLSGDPTACPISPSQPWLPSAPDSRAPVRLEVEVPATTRPADPAVALTLTPLGERRFRLTCYPASRPGWPFSLHALFDELRAGELRVTVEADRSLTLRWN